ncbi:MAG TPA: hypothetical protein PLN94_11535, partial [Thiolinea sp.]|nr:hypothetical protein [Thiolinea sp.]
NGAVYNLLSDKGIQVNSTFNNNFMQDFGITLGQDQIAFDKAGKLTINGEEQKGDGEFLNGKVSRKGNQVTVQSGEYTMKMAAVQNRYMNIDFTSDNAAADGVMPHGLWGQSADGDGKARRGSGFDGTGAIERLDGTMAKKGDKTYQLYEVNGLFDTGFANFNRFNGGFTGVPATPVAAQGNGE